MISCFAMRSPLAGRYRIAGNCVLAQDISNISGRKSIPPREFPRAAGARPLRLWVFLLFGALLFSQPACVRQNEASLAEIADITSYESGDLQLSQRADAPRNIFVEASDTEGVPLKVSDSLKSALGGENFHIVEAPSQAGYILHINVLQEGAVNPEVLKNLVQAGYDSNARFSGQGGEALLADVLLVQRRVPSEKKAAHARLKNISTRNALESARMRIGVLIPRPVANHAAARQALGLRLARSLRSALASGSMANAAMK